MSFKPSKNHVQLLNIISRVLSLLAGRFAGNVQNAHCSIIPYVLNCWNIAVFTSYQYIYRF